MSFGGGGFGGSSGGFGGFGSNNNSTTNTTTSSLFGGNTATAGGFGGFGSNNNAATSNPFGAARTGFGATGPSTGGSLFGGGANTNSGFGSNTASNTGTTLGTGFGANNNNNNTTSLFGANRPAAGGFGSTNTSTGGLFGSNNASTGFGANNTTSNPFASTTNSSTNPFGGASSTTGGFGATNNTTSTFGGFGNNAAASTTQGTAATPFSAVTEKDTSAAGGTSAYQTITMQPQYQGKSLDELRLEDYAQNRRLAQSNSFGASNTFGGFGGNNTANASNNRSLFGGGSNTGGFGASNTTGFGANNTNNATSGGLFGANNATGGLFGNNSATTNTTTGGFGATANTGGGLFGSNNATNNTTPGFGGGFGANNNTSGGLFGSNNNQNKGGFGGFGSTNNAATSTNTGSLFGSAANNTTQPASGGLFGSNTNTGGFGANSGSSLFASNNNQPKTGPGLFGATTNTGNTGGLFGASNQPASTGFGASTGTGLFGSNNNNTANTGGGLFGAANQNKAGGTALFGSTTANTGNTGGLFGGATNNNNQGGGLFGNNNAANTGSSLFNNQPKQNTSLFGGNTGGGGPLFGGNNNAGGSLFGNNSTANQGGSLFGASANQNNSGGSLFGINQNQPQQNQLTASITGDPYGNAQLFASLASPSPPVGPLATPLSGARPAPKARASLLASVRGSPMLGANSTPRARPGYGFSYSNYNSPAASTPILTPGASSLLRPTGSLGSTLNSRLSKSFSTSNLRSEASEGQSLLRTPAQGQGSLLLGGSGSLGSGSIRKLKIDRSLRIDLFGDSSKKPTESREDKRVSFDQSAGKENNASTAKPSASNALVVRDEVESTQATPEPAQANGGSSLTTVHEEGGVPVSDQTTPRKPVEGGEYFTEPQLKHLHAMSRSQLSNIKSFTVGRQGVGKIVFGRGATVDLTGVPIDDICGKIVQLKPRSATVYQDDSDKPPVGKGLNMPSTIYLEQSWPRKTRVSGATAQASSAKEIERHKNRLRKVSGTSFVDYNEDTGVWSFTVEHFTTYELDDEDETTIQDTTNLTEEQDAGVAETTQHSFETDKSMESPEIGEQDDTFQFKLARRSEQSTMSLPGGFDDSMANLSYEYDEPSADEMQADEFVEAGGLGEAALQTSAIEEGAVQPPSPGAVQRYEEDLTEMAEDEVQEIPGSFHNEIEGLKGILKPYDRVDNTGSPNMVNMPWEEQLQRTLSPKKRDRQALKDIQPSFANKTDADPDTLLKKSLLSRSQLGQSHLATKGHKKGDKDQSQPSQAFKTSMDIMKSLWADEPRSSHKTAGLLEASRAINRARLSRSSTDANEPDFHQSLKPSFDNKGTIVYATRESQNRSTKKASRQAQHVHLLPSDSAAHDLAAKPFLIQRDSKNTIIEFDDDMMDEDEPEQLFLPEVMTSSAISFASLAESITAESNADKREKGIWRLCSVLFDPFEQSCPALVAGMSEEWTAEFGPNLRKDVFYELWDDELRETVAGQLKGSSSAEATALYHLTVGNVLAASEVLSSSDNHRLAILIAQLPGNNNNREMIRQQVDTWSKRKDWSEFSDGQRALYSILAGNTCLVQGVTGAKEDRASSFCLSERFGLTWKQSLALKIRYGAERLEEAVEAYVADLASDEEKTLPIPEHATAESRAEDTLLSLLKIYTEQTEAEDLLDNTVVSSNPDHYRVTWQMATVLAAKGLVRLEDDKSDALTLAFAWEQETSGNFIDAIWVLLHLNDDDSRVSAVRAVLERNSANLSEDNTFQQITEELQVHPSLFYAAKASHARSALQDYWKQCEYLLLASTPESLQEAHTVLCRDIGPIAVIQQRYDSLLQLCASMHGAGSHRFEDWRTGGQLYYELAQYMQLTPEARHKKEGVALLKKLDKSLAAQDETGQEDLTLEMRVARLELRKIIKENAKVLDNAETFRSAWKTGEAVHRNKGHVLLERYLHALGGVS